MGASVNTTENEVMICSLEEVGIYHMLLLCY